jgi:hypothetical protein
MKTKITNYINAEDFEVIINSDFPHKKANIIAKSLCDVVVVFSVGDKFTSYILQENLTYINSSNVEAYLKPTITLLLEISFEKLTEHEKIKSKIDSANNIEAFLEAHLLIIFTTKSLQS